MVIVSKCLVCKKRIVTVTDVFIEFCEKTATRGLPRAVKETNFVWKIIWYLSVLAMFCFAVSQITILLIQYFRYEVIQRETTVSDNHYNFPSVTVCNLSPIKSISNVSKSHPEIPQHLSTLTNYYTFIDTLKSLNPQLSSYLNVARSTEGFYHNIPKQKQHLYGHSALDLVNSCVLRMSNGFSSFYVVNCSVITVTQSPLFYNCFTIEMSEVERRRAMTLSLVLYLDESSYPMDLKYTQSEDIFGFSLGAKVAVHEFGTYPDIGHTTVRVGPGLSSWVNLQAKKWHKLGLPYEPCIDEKDYEKYQIEDNGILYKYSKIGCRMSCLQRFLVNSCSCLEPSWPMTSYQITTYPYCLNISDLNGLEAYKDRLNCRRSIEFYDPTCNKMCISRCVRYGFGEQLSSSGWPHVSKQLPFYEQHIKAKHYAGRFFSYESLLSYAKKIDGHGNSTQQELLYKNLYNQDLIGRNFLQINVHRDFELRYISEIPAYALQQLLSGIGGIFSLTIGITIITIVEMLELIYRLVLYFFFHLKWSQSSSRTKDACDCYLSKDCNDNSNNANGLSSSYGSIIGDGLKQ